MMPIDPGLQCIFSSSSAIVDFAREHPTNLVKVGAAQGSIRVAAGGRCWSGVASLASFGLLGLDFIF
jgi:transketolase C-terminal domain/subunit